MNHPPLIRSTLLFTAALLLACGDDGGPTASDETDPRDELVAAIRLATTGYADADAALEAGFVPASPCVEGPDGGMGFHYLHAGRTDAVVDETEPEMLLFAPTSTGALQLAGVEFLVPAEEWEAAGNSAPPTLVGQPFADHRSEADRHGIPFPHYDLHVWAWTENAAGLFHPFNPAVSCSGASLH